VPQWQKTDFVVRFVAKHLSEGIIVWLFWRLNPVNRIANFLGDPLSILPSFNLKQMKKVYFVIIMLVLVASIEGCSSFVSAPGKSGSAPGQVKKTTGSQSAKPYAPGQKKN